MANITIGNNGQEARNEVQADPENNVEWRPAVEATENIKITDISGLTRTLKPGQSIGLPLGKYVVEVM